MPDASIGPEHPCSCSFRAAGWFDMSRLNQTRACLHRAIAMKRTALRWMGLALHLVAAAAGSCNENAGIGLLAQQIEIVGLWPWLRLVTSMATGTPLVAAAPAGSPLSRGRADKPLAAMEVLR